MIFKPNFLGVGKAGGNNSFIFTINTALGDGTPTFKLPLTGAATHNFVVDWGDSNQNTITSFNQAETDHTYSSGGIYQITITGKCGTWSFGDVTTDKDKITSVDSCGDVAFEYLFEGFDQCLNLTSIPDGAGAVLFRDVTSSVSRLFRQCKITAFNNYNLYNVTDISLAFQNCDFMTSNSGNVYSNVTNFLQSFTFIGSTFTFDFSQITSAPTTLQQMFTSSNNATLLNIDQLDISNLVNATIDATISTAEYDALLISWESQFPTGNTFTLDLNNSKYTLGGAAEAARTSLINTYGITIIDGGGV